MLVWQAQHEQILKDHEFVQCLRNPFWFVHVRRDVRLLDHGDDFMVEMTGKCTGKVLSDRNTAKEASFLNLVIRWDSTSGRAESEADTRRVAIVFRDLGLEKTTAVVTPVTKHPKWEELVLLAGAKPIERS